MGNHDQWRDFLCYLFAHAFINSVTQGTEMDHCIIDATQFISMIKNRERKEGFRARQFCDSLIRMVYDYTNYENQSERPQINGSTVVLFDSPKFVPHNKAATQMERDGNDEPEEEEEEEVEEEETEKKGPNPAPVVVVEKEAVIMNGAMYEAVLKELGIQPGEFMIHVNMPNPCYAFEGNTIWRSNTTRWQLTRMVVTEMMSHVKVPPGKTLVLDDAVVVGPEVYRGLRETMIAEYGFHSYSPFEQEVLVAFLMNHCLAKRVILYEGGEFATQPVTGIGEADIKICHYIKGDEGPKRYLVVSQDTDMLFILLLHMRRVYDAGVEIFIDSQTPSDRASQVSRPYRYVNVRALYEAILDLFAREYPTIEFPIETLTFLAHLGRTDFSKPFDPFLRISPLRIWNLFSELHHPEDTKNGGGAYITFRKKPAVEGSKAMQGAVKRGYTYMDGVERCSKRVYASDMSNVLGSGALICMYDSETEVYHLELDERRCEQFLYYLAQRRLQADLALAVARPTTLAGRARRDPRVLYLCEPDILLSHASDLCRVLENSRTGRSNESDVAIARLTANNNATPAPPAKHTLNKFFRPQVARISPAITLPPTQPLNLKQVSQLASRKIPPNYAIPTRSVMQRRIKCYRWILAYLQNASVDTDFSTCYSETSPLDDSLHLYGWRDLEVVGDMELANSGYCRQSLCKVLLGEIPLVSYRTVETNK